MSKKSKEHEDFQDYIFEVRGRFSIAVELKPMCDAGGNICGFVLPDGREVDLAICLRVDNSKKEKWITDERKMAKLGFDGLDYGWSEFYLVNDEAAANAESK